MKSYRGFWIPAIVFLALVGAASGQSAEATDEAVTVAESWLGIIDSGEYGQSWGEAAVLFKNAVAKEQWEQTLQATRATVGSLVTRRLKSATYRTSLPGAPDGEYVVIQFSTSFTGKKQAVETVTPMKDPDGRWRVSGYYLK